MSAVDLHLAQSSIPEDQTISGEPTSGLVELCELAGAAVGIWETSEGVSRDVEAEEVFVVLSGRATVETDDGARIDLEPGVVVRLASGTHTIWTVHEPLRKVYFAINEPEGPDDANS